jgi:hypothetical protein
MKKIRSISVIMLLVVFIAFTACTKQNETTSVSPEDEIALLSDQAVNGLDLQEVYSDKTGMDIYMENEGIPPDFLVEESDLAGKDTLRANIRDHSFIACLRGLNLLDKQVAEIKQDLRTYSGCKENAIKRVKAIYRDLHEKYKAKFQRINDAFKNGTITREKFKELVAALKKEFRKELSSLQLKEKLHDALRECFRIFLKDLHSILTERQWNAFVECYKR